MHMDESAQDTMELKDCEVKDFTLDFFLENL